MASTGRPNRLHAVVRYDGHTETTAAELILDETRNGQPLETAAALAGLSVSTVRNWLRNGARVEERLLINPDAPTDQDDLDYREFLVSFDRARAEAHAEFVRLMGELARGGTLKRISRKTDGQGNVVEETSTVETARPSFQALDWIIRNQYDRRTMGDRVDDGALSDDERAEQLADAIETWMAEQPDPTANGHSTNGSHE